MAEPIRVVIADDHPLVLQGIRETIRQANDIALVGEARRGDEVQNLCQKLQPDVLLLDLQMPGPSAIETTTVLHSRCPRLRVVILTAYDDAIYIHRMIAAGIAGYVLKDEVTESIPTAIRSVMQGGAWFSRRVLNISAHGNLASSPATGGEPVLSEFEQQLLRHLMAGLRDKEIAETLRLSARRVRDELSRKLYATLGVETRTQAVAWGWKHGYRLAREEEENMRR